MRVLLLFGAEIKELFRAVIEASSLSSRISSRHGGCHRGVEAVVEASLIRQHLGSPSGIEAERSE